MIVDRARKLRKVIEELAINLDDTQAADNKELFPQWDIVYYKIGDRIRYDGVLYKVLQDHMANEAYTPDIAVSLYAEVLIPDPHVIPDWVQPGSTNPYMKGDKVRHVNKIWISDIDYNVFEPGVAGWSEVI